MKKSYNWLIAIAVALVLTVPAGLIKDRIDNIKKIELERQKQLIELLQRSDSQLEESKKKEQELQTEVDRLQKELSVKKSTQSRLATSTKKCEQYRSLVSQYNWPVETALSIMYYESRCNSNASSPTNDHGLMQINKGLAIYGDSIYDPAFNVKVAYEQKYLKGGFRHWMVCGKYVYCG